jgi:hypothetical protein
MILERAKLNTRTPFFNPAALEDLSSYVQTCDEVMHEAARGVLVAFDRMAVLDLTKKRPGKESAVKDPKIYLSFQERTRWPLFQQRIKVMMEALMHAKLDLTLHILVYWTVWEAESRRKFVSSLPHEAMQTNPNTLDLNRLSLAPSPPLTVHPSSPISGTAKSAAIRNYPNHPSSNPVSSFLATPLH